MQHERRRREGWCSLEVPRSMSFVTWSLGLLHASLTPFFSIDKTLLSVQMQNHLYQARTAAGELESEWKTASNLTYLRRQLSVCIVTGVAESLLTRLQQAGNAGRGARQAAQRRAMAMGREERGRRERAAHWLLHTRGYRVLQRGQFLNQWTICIHSLYLLPCRQHSHTSFSINVSRRKTISLISQKIIKVEGETVSSIAVVRKMLTTDENVQFPLPRPAIRVRAVP